MRVAHIIASIDPKFGGGTYAFRELTLACAQAGVEVHQFFTLPEGVSADALQSREKPLPHTVVHRHRGDSWGAALDLCAEIFREHRRNPFDVLHIHGLWLPLVIASGWWASYTGIPTVISTHGMLLPWAFSYKRSKKRLAWWLYQKRLLQGAACIHATSEVEVAEIRRLGLRPPVALVPLGIGTVPENPVPLESLESRQRVALYLGRLHPVKNLPALLEAWSESRPQGWELHLVGPDEGGHGAELARYVERLGIADTVRFLGPALDDDKWKAIERCDLLVLPSFSENFGIVVAEALAMGRPVIASQGTPWSSLQAEQCGWWVGADAAELGSALRAATSKTRDELSAMGRRGRALVERHYRWSTSGRTLAEVYASMLDGTAARPAAVSGPAFKPVRTPRSRSHSPFALQPVPKTPNPEGTRIGIITFHRAHNYGAVIQGYALQQALLGLGANPFFIDYDPDYVERGGSWEWPVSKWALKANLVNAWLRYVRMKEWVLSGPARLMKFEQFHRAFLLDGPRRYKSLGELRKHPPEADAYIVGSDQVWNPTTLYGIDRAFLLDFGGDHVRRYSYAASFGRDRIEDVHGPFLQSTLPRFDGISVREESGCNLVRQLAGCPARCDPDPTLLIDSFEPITARIRRPRPFIFCYVLRSGKALPVTLNRLSAMLDAEVITVRNPHQRWRLPGTAIGCGPEEWLGHIKAAKFVVTNSYHGTIFSVLFHKPFITVGLSAAKASLNERARALLGKLGLGNRLVSDPSDAELSAVLAESIDWASVDERVRQLRLGGLSYLREICRASAPKARP